MTTDEKLELIEVYRRITALENKVFKWKRRWVWILGNVGVWLPMVIAASTLIYLGYIIGAAFGFSR